MNTILHLLKPSRMALINRWKKSSTTEKTLISGFSLFGLLFWIALAGLMYFFISSFYSIEIVGSIVLRKLIEVLLLSLFGMLCFSNVVTALSNYYLSEDLELLLSLPVSKTDFYFARFTETLTQSSWMVVSLATAILISYGIVYDQGLSYYGLLSVVMLCFSIIPTSIGVSIASILVSVFPARRIREALVLVSILVLVVVFILIRVLRPEQLADAENFESVAAYMTQLQTPMPILNPPTWAANVLIASLYQRSIPWVEFSLLIAGSITGIAVSRRITQKLYDDGRAKAQEARVARLAGSQFLDNIIAIWTLPLPRKARSIVSKDIKTFVRDPAQWTQLFLVGSIVVIAIVSVANLPVDSFRGPWMQTWLNGLSFLILALVGFVMAALAARFQFAAVSNESRGFWIVRTGPLSAREFLWAKAFPGFLPMLLVGETLAVSSITILDAQSAMLWVGIGTALGFSFALSGIAVGMGAMYPDFKTNNAAKLAASPAGLLYMLTALGLVFGVLAIEATPVYWLIASQIRETEITSTQMLVGGACFAVAIAICLFATIYPIHKGAQTLWDRELPNG